LQLASVALRLVLLAQSSSEPLIECPPVARSEWLEYPRDADDANGDPLEEWMSARSGFRIDHDAVDRGRLMLGIQKPVAVRITYYDRSQIDGRYICERDGVHRIGVDGAQSPKAASKVLWHELAHVLQAERLGGHDAFDRLWRAEMKAADVSAAEWTRGKRGRRYRRTPLEAEAEAVAREHAPRLRLCVKR
jgi:hypothetical protein